MLNAAQDEFNKTPPDLRPMYTAINTIQPIVEIHKNTGFFAILYRYMLCIFVENALKTHSECHLLDVKENIEYFSKRAYGG